VQALPAFPILDMNDFAAEALVSRAMAYRFSPDADALLVEATLDDAAPTGEEIFASRMSRSAVAKTQSPLSPSQRFQSGRKKSVTRWVFDAMKLG
jgi:hypothetical protein